MEDIIKRKRTDNSKYVKALRQLEQDDGRD